MSQTRNQVYATFVAGETIPAYTIVAPTSTDNTVEIHDTASSLILGVAADDSSGGAGSSVKVVVGGTAKIICGASVSAGEIVTPQTATGYAIAGISDFGTATTLVPRTVGIALQAGSTNSVIEVALIINNIYKDAF